MKLRCKILGKFIHKWRYFKCDNGVELRVCKFCGHTQQYKTIPNIDSLGRFGMNVWMNCVERTQYGAKLRTMEMDKELDPIKTNEGELK